MPRLPSTSCAPRPTRASRTRVFTGWVSGSGEGRGRAEGRSAARRAERGVRGSAGGQQPGQQAVQTRSRSTWIRPTRSTVVAATDAYSLPNVGGLVFFIKRLAGGGGL